MERMAPFRVVTRLAVVLAKESIVVRSPLVSPSSPRSSTKFSTQAQKVSPAPVVSMVPPSVHAGTNTRSPS